MIVTIFRSRLRSDVGDDYPPMADHMLELARQMPGFVDFKQFTAADGERLSLIVFESAEAQHAWRDHPAHREAQDAGRTRFYESYSIDVCELIRRREFQAGHAGQP
jgi:heme-degrading monooxygenase HmoA